MTYEVVHEALQVAQISTHQQAEVATRVIQTGTKILAILALIECVAEVLKFIEADELEDARLPFRLEILKHEIGLNDPEDFEEKQWEITAPTFARATLNRTFHDKIILPFSVKIAAGRGAYGKVYTIRVPQDHLQDDNAFPQEVSIPKSSQLIKG
jgi:hypothetical protein